MGLDPAAEFDEPDETAEELLPAFADLPAREPMPRPAPHDSRYGRRQRQSSAEALPDTSFVDRYRGTEWDSAPPPPQDVVSKKSRRPPTWLVLLGGGALLAVGLAGGVHVALGSLHSGGVTGFVHMTTAPAQAPVIVIPSATPDPSNSGSTPPLPSPTPPPWASNPLHPAARFIAAMTAANVSYHVDINFTMTGASASAAMGEAADVSGTDFSILATLSTPSKTTRIACVYKSGFYYDQLDIWPWVERPLTAPPVGVLGNLTSDTWTGLQYFGPETVGGRSLNHLRLPILGWPGDSYGMKTLGVSVGPPMFIYDFWVDDNGKPINATISAPVTMRIDGRDVQVSMTAVYTFSKFGGRIKIVAPTHYWKG